MGGWLKDVKDADKVGLLLLYTGLFVSLVGTCFTIFIVFHVKDENTLDRVLVAIAGLTAQGAGLVTAAMGVLRFQSKSADPPIVDVKQTTTSTTVATNSQEPK